MSEWKPIETAPREDEDFKILAYDADTGTMDVVWLSWLKDDCSNMRKWFNGDVVDWFTHWQHLPKPPSTQSQDADPPPSGV